MYTHIYIILKSEAQLMVDRGEAKVSTLYATFVCVCVFVCVCECVCVRDMHIYIYMYICIPRHT